MLYILKSLYVRVLEDQGLLPTPRIRDGGAYQLFRTLFPQLGYAAYLRTIFSEAERSLPELFAPTAVEIAEPGEASAAALWTVWQESAPGGGPRFDFRGELDTRFIGDLYQDLDPDVKARYALLQTPRFIEEFILDRTLTPALASFGLHDFRIIDPTCGSGHFLLGAFERLFLAWTAEFGTDTAARWEAAKKALVAVYGADLNEYACALSRFRLLLAVVRATGVVDLLRLRSLHMNVIVCDSLIPWERIQREMLPGMVDVSWLARYGSDVERQRNEEFFSSGFHAVVGNPPYIAVKDKKKREDYRRAWPRSASGKYSLSAPMTERFLLLPMPRGRAGIIVANNFCKRSFGKGVVEKALRDVRLDAVIDSSGAYIPGHGTPTVMLFATNTKVGIGRHEVVVVAGKRGEPREPLDPANGIVWSDIATHWNDVGYEDTWIAVQSVAQESLVRHPWSLGSDTVTAIKAKLDAFPRLRELGGDASIAVVIGEDEAFLRRYSYDAPLRKMIYGDAVRDWVITKTATVLLPSNVPREADLSIDPLTAGPNDLWPLRTTLRMRGWRNSTFQALRKPWWSFAHTALAHLGEGIKRIVVGEIATNCHFVYDSSDAVFGQTAPVLTLRGADERLYRDVAAVLNSSTLEFWFKQVCFDKGNGGINGGIAAEDWEKFYVRNGTNVVQAPLPQPEIESPTNLVQQRDAIVKALTAALDLLRKSEPGVVFREAGAMRLSSQLTLAELETKAARERLVALQEELDWSIYAAFGLIDDSPTLSDLGQAYVERGHRPFEIALARRIERGEEASVWFERHGLTPTSDIPERYRGPMRTLLEERLALIENEPTLAILEQPVYKRRWTFEPWEAMVGEAATKWLLDSLDTIVARAPRMFTTDDLLAELRLDPKAAVVGAYAKGGRDVDLTDTVTRLLKRESIPDNAARVFTPAGLAKYLASQTADGGAAGEPPAAEAFAEGERVDWKRVWRLQEREDAGQDVSIPVPPPFKNGDYLHPNGWRIRGKFNIPNERLIVYDELNPNRYAWGGWTIPERARLSGQAFDLRDREPDDASIQPTLEDPRRCGIQFPLWDKLDGLRRTSDSGYEDVKMLAQLCGRSCPCDVLERWRAQGTLRRNGAVRANGRTPLTATGEEVLRTADTSVDPAVLETAAEMIRASGFEGIPAAALEPVFSGDPIATKRAIERLRVDGRIEAFGKGRGTRYRLAQARLV